MSLQDITLTFYSACLLHDLPLEMYPTQLIFFAAMVKNSSLIFVLLFAFLFHLETFSLRLVGVILLILVGEVLMVATETKFSLKGFILVLTASASAGLRWSLTQLLLKKKSNKEENMGLETPPAALFWMTPAMGVALAILSMAIYGWIAIFTSKFFNGFGVAFWTSMFILFPGVIAFCMVLSEF